MEKDYIRPNYSVCDGFIIPGAFSVEAFRSAINYKPKSGELFMVTYPKCGTTWMQFIVMLILRKGKPIMTETEFMMSNPFLEFAGADGVDFMKGPGAIKTHLPLSLFPVSPDAKYIYVARNPKDCCVSFYYHTKCIPFYNFHDGTFDEFLELFINGKTDYGDYFDHLLPWYEHKDDLNVCFVTYEDLKKDTKREILKIAKFIGEEHYERLQNNSLELDDILYYSSLDYMKEVVNNKKEATFTENARTVPKDAILPSGVKAYLEYMVKHPNIGMEMKGDFVRKGIAGDWENHFTPEQNARMEEWIKRRTEGNDVMSLWKII